MDVTINGTTVTLVRHRSFGDRTVYRHPAHTLQAPYLVHVRGRDGNADRADVLDVKVVRGGVDADGQPFDKNLIMEVSLYRPINYDLAAAQDVIDTMQSLAVSSIWDDFASSQALPSD